jgi:tetratricopeptide (TPR) repeat protein
VREVSPESPHGYSLQGDVAMSRGEWPAAERAYRAALERDPESEATLHRLTVALGEQGKNREALQVQEQAVRMDPVDPSMTHDLWVAMYRAIRRRIRWITAGALAVLIVGELALGALDDSLGGAVLGALRIGYLLLVVAAWFVLVRRAPVDVGASPEAVAAYREARSADAKAQRERMRRPTWVHVLIGVGTAGFLVCFFWAFFAYSGQNVIGALVLWVLAFVFLGVSYWADDRGPLTRSRRSTGPD